MQEKLFGKYIYPIVILLGGIFGVGFLSLPYIASKVGIWIMLVYFIVITILILVTHLIFGEVCLKTPDFKQFPGFVGFHLGKTAKTIILVLIIIESFGGSLVYMTVGGQFLTDIFKPVFGGNMLIYVLLYFIAGSALIFWGTKAIAKFEFWAMILLLVSLALILIKGFYNIKLGNIFFNPEIPFLGFKTLFLPYGALIFSLWGTGMIPEVEEMLRGDKKIFKKIIIVATLGSAAIYLFFTFLVLGITGPKTTESALEGLRYYLGGEITSLAIFMGAVMTFSSFVLWGIFLKKTFIYDMKIKEIPAWMLTCFIPLLLFLFGINQFIPIISFAGSVILGFVGILILMMYRKVGGKKIIVYPLFLIFVAGIIYEIFFIIK